MKYAIYPPEEMIEDAVVTLPLSKSISTRSLVLDALTPGGGGAGAIADCDDTRVIADAIALFRSSSKGAAITVDVKASGAALRFLTAFFAVQDGCDVTLMGEPRLCQRPKIGRAHV